MGNWFIEQWEFKPVTLETVNRELVAGPFESYEECNDACVVLAGKAVAEGMQEVTPKCYTGQGYTGNLFRLSPETERGHADSVKRDRFRSSAKLLASWVAVGQPPSKYDPQWITDIIGEEN